MDSCKDKAPLRGQEKKLLARPSSAAYKYQCIYSFNRLGTSLLKRVQRNQWSVITDNQQWHGLGWVHGNVLCSASILTCLVKCHDTVTHCKAKWVHSDRLILVMFQHGTELKHIAHVFDDLSRISEIRLWQWCSFSSHSSINSMYRQRQ